MTPREPMSTLFPLVPRLPPANILAEQSLLGAILANNKAYERVGDFLRPEHFADPIHGRIYQAIAKRCMASQLADVLTLKSEFEHSGILDEVGGTSYLSQLLSAMVAIINAGEYGRAIRDAWVRRQIIDIGETAVNDAFGQIMETTDLVSTIIARLDAAMGGACDRGAVSLDDAMDAALQAAADAAKRQGPAGISTGFRDIDERLGGLEDETLNVLAGRPGMGKTALGYQWALAAARAGIGVCVISLEMSSKELGRRALAAAAGVPVWDIKRGHITEKQMIALGKARHEMLNKLPFTIEDGAGLTASQIDLRVRAAHRKHGVGLIMVDHLHIVKPDDADVRAGATWAVGRISGAMKRMAKQHRVPVLLLAQLNRGVENRDDKRPALADLRQAGDIEQDADTVSFVYRAEYYMKKEPERSEGESEEKYSDRVAAWRERKAQVAGKAELIVEKIRDGAPGIINLRFNGETAAFYDNEGGRDV